MSPPLRLLERNLVAWRGMWLIFISVMVEPIFFLFSIGVGVGKLVGDITLSSGQTVPYREFVAAGLLASSAMMGPVFDSTFNFFVKLKYIHTYQAVLSTPMGPRDVVMGELLWSLVRATLYAAAFLVAIVIMGLTSSWWALLCVPVALLIGFAFAGAGLGATTFMRSFIDFDLVNLVIIPMFLFSGTFFPVSQYPDRPAVGGAVHPAVPGGGAGASADPGRRQSHRCWCTWSTWRSWARWACEWPDAGSTCCSCRNRLACSAMSTAPEPAGQDRAMRWLSMLFLVWLLGLLGVVAAVSSLTRWQWQVAMIAEGVVSVVLAVGVLWTRRRGRRRAADAQG